MTKDACNIFTYKSKVTCQRYSFHVWRHSISGSKNLLSSARRQIAGKAKAWRSNPDYLGQRRKAENVNRFPNGGWARLDSIKMGKWKPWHPRSVLIPADGFMEKDHDQKSHWITFAPRMAIQALLAERDGEQRVYVVTEETLSEYHWIHDRWPRLRKVSDSKLSLPD